jgi:hypothetical protein
VLKSVGRKSNPILAYIDFIQTLRVRSGRERLLGDEAVKDIIKLFLKGLAYITPALLILRLAGALNMVTSTIISLFFASVFPILKYLRDSSIRAKHVEREFNYFIVSEDIASDGFCELISDLRNLTEWHEVFPTLAREGERIKVFGNLLTSIDAAKLYIKTMPSKKVRRLLSDYLYALSLGSVREWLRGRSSETLKALSTDSRTITKLRMTLSLIAAVILGYVPPILVGLSTIVGEAILIPALTLTLSILPMIMVALPKQPLHTNAAKTPLDKYTLAGIVTGAICLLTGLMIPNYHYLILLSAVSFLAVGLRGAVKLGLSLREGWELPRVLSTYGEAPLIVGNPLSILRDVLLSSKYKPFTEMAKNLTPDKLPKALHNLKLWISKFVFYTIIKSVYSGSVNKERVINLKSLVLDMLEDVKMVLASSAIIVGMSIALPWLVTTLSGLSYISSPLLSIYRLTSPLAYSIFASYVVFDDIKNTLLPGVTILILYLSGGFWL